MNKHNIVAVKSGLKFGNINTVAEQDFLNKTNALRASLGIGPLKINSELLSKARNWSQTQADAGSVWAQQAEIKQLEAVTVSAGPIIESNNVGSFSTLTTRVGEAQIEDMGALDLAGRKAAATPWNATSNRSSTRSITIA